MKSNECFKKRSRPSVVRIQITKFNTEDCYYGLTLLYYPHRTYADNLNPTGNAKEAFLQNQNHFDQLALTSCHSIYTEDRSFISCTYISYCKTVNFTLNSEFDLNLRILIILSNTPGANLDGAFIFCV